MQGIHRTLDNRAKQIAWISICAIVLAATALAGVGGSASARKADCPVVVIGVAGTFQGPQHPDPTLDKSSPEFGFGKEVATAIGVLARKTDIKAIAIDYPAVGADWANAVAARVAYDMSKYKASKDAGYSAAYNTLKSEAAKCGTAKFALVGYSQGAHVVGDLAQSVFHGNGPVDRSRIAAVVLIADPAYNGPSPRTIEAIYSGERLTQDQDHWKVGGSLGQRAYFQDGDPVVSVCIYGDPVCDDADLVGQDGKVKPLANQWMHGLYVGYAFEGERDIATWAGVQAARFLPGRAPVSQPQSPSPTQPAPRPAPPAPPTSSAAPASQANPAPVQPTPPVPAVESVTITQTGSHSVTVTVAEAGGAGPRAIRCWNATDATHKWNENYLGETRATIPRNGTFTVDCPTAPRPGTFSLEFFQWRWSPAIEWH